MNALIIGCGAVGRGLIAPLLLRAGHAVTFADNNVAITSQLERRLYYPVMIERGGEIGLRGPCGESLLEYRMSPLNDIDIVFVCVRVENFRAVGETLKTKLSNRTSKNVLPIIVCENTPNAAEKLRTIAGLYENVFYRSAIAECIIPEMPIETRMLDPLLTYVDPRGYLLIDGRDWRGEKPRSFRIDYTNRFGVDWDLKWYCHCALHAVVGLLGRKSGHIYVHEAMSDKRILDKLLLLMGNVQRALEAKHDMRHIAVSEINQRIEMELSQLKDCARPDTCERVTRDLARKIQKGERLMDTLELLGGKNEVLEEALEYAKVLVG